MLPSPDSILFLDIETVSAYETLPEVPEALRELWLESASKKRKRKKEEGEEENSGTDSDYEKASMQAEFGRVICISLGRFDGGLDEEHFIKHSIRSHVETEILTEFAKILQKYPGHNLCAHNGKGFDFPFLGKRFLINGMPLPNQLNTMGKKPWEIPLLDTMELWSFGAKGHGTGTALKLLCAVFGIPSPKDDISGADVRRVYYEEKDLERIAKYCEKDVVALAMIYLKMVGAARTIS
jgi:predicted PolB exonuclease-like 3'-5' exonuclease